MGNIIDTESKPYQFCNGRLVKFIDPSEIELPKSKVLPKYTTVIGASGPFALFEDLSVIDLGDVIDTNIDILKNSAMQSFFNQFIENEIPIVLTFSDASTIMMLSKHAIDLSIRSDSTIKKMMKYTCKGYLLEHTGNTKGIERLGAGITIIDIPDELDPSVFKRILKQSKIDAIVSNHVVHYIDSDTVVEEGVFKVYIKEEDGVWKLSVNGDTDPITVKASVLQWRPAANKESLMSQLKPYLYSEDE